MAGQLERRMMLNGDGAERRYYATPDDRAVKAAASRWDDERSLAYCCGLVFDSVDATTRLAVTVHEGHHIATLYTSREFEVEHCQAVSGWGPTTEMAVRELAFRWRVLMGGSWLSGDHVKRLGLRGPMMARLVAALNDPD